MRLTETKIKGRSRVVLDAAEVMKVQARMQRTAEDERQQQLAIQGILLEQSAGYRRLKERNGQLGDFLKALGMLPVDAKRPTAAEVEKLRSIAMKVYQPGRAYTRSEAEVMMEHSLGIDATRSKKGVDMMILARVLLFAGGQWHLHTLNE